MKPAGRSDQMIWMARRRPRRRQLSAAVGPDARWLREDALMRLPSLPKIRQHLQVGLLRPGAGRGQQGMHLPAVMRLVIEQVHHT